MRSGVGDTDSMGGQLSGTAHVFRMILGSFPADATLTRPEQYHQARSTEPARGEE